MLQSQTSSTPTPLPIQLAMAELPAGHQQAMRYLRRELQAPENPAADRPGAIIGYCLDLLGSMPFPRASVRFGDAYERLAQFRDTPRQPLLRLSPLALHAFFLPLFRLAWSVETTNPSFAAYWSQQNPSVGQQVSTALVLQELVGGRLFMAPVESYGLHVWNLLESDGLNQELDLTRRQFHELMQMPRDLVSMCTPDQVRAQFLWAPTASAQLKERVRELLIAYAFAAYALLSA